MSSFFNLTLDTLAPQGVTVKINNGAIYTANKAVNLSISCSDADTTGYSMKIYGSIVGAATADDAKWETYSPTKQVSLTDGDGLKTVYVIIRDAVWNESTAASSTITLNTAIPVVTVVGPDVSIISEITGKNSSKFNFTSDQAFDEYKVGIVHAENSSQADCVIIGETGGSTNTSGKNGNYPASENIETTIIGSDFKTAAGGADGTYIVKVFVKNQAGTWST